jgi:2-polyprenyl-3-methyl-5-hydroxy-6-metoxy-1,4-benzoquinol methylase
MKNPLDSHLGAYEGKNLYDFDNNIQLNWYPQRVLLHAGDAESLLELGLGHGITTDTFSRHFRRHVVLDASPAVIAHFKQNFPECRAQIIESYFEQFESDERFDVVVMGFVLEHVDDPAVVLKHFKKFLTPAGRMFVTVPNAEVLNRKLGHLAGMLTDMQLLSDHDHLCGHKRYFTVRSLTDLVHAAGYKIEKMEGIYLKPLATAQMISLNLDPKVLKALCVVGVEYPELCCGILAQLGPV